MIGTVLPSFIIIFTISLFFEAFLALEYVKYAFRGIQACVAFIIVTAGFKMLKKLKKNVFNVVLLCLTIGCMLTLSLLAVDFSSIFYILIGGFIGLSTYVITLCVKKNRERKQIKESNEGGNE
jgi:chromate transporter